MLLSILRPQIYLKNPKTFYHAFQVLKHVSEKQDEEKKLLDKMESPKVVFHVYVVKFYSW